jgi:hypothetical protein
MIGLLVTYEQGGKALTLARVSNRSLLLSVAREAISEKRQQAEALSDIDEVLSVVADEDADSLERKLTMLIPELGISTAATSAVQ